MISPRCNTDLSIISRGAADFVKNESCAEESIECMDMGEGLQRTACVVAASMYIYGMVSVWVQVGGVWTKDS